MDHGNTVTGLVDAATLAAITAQSQTVRAVGHWLAGFRWQLYLVLTFAHPPRPESLQQAVEAWYDAMCALYPRLYIYASADRGGATGHWNVHLLVGGLFQDRPPPPPHYGLALARALGEATQAWRRGQVVRAEPYESRRGAPHYLAQYWDDPQVPPSILGRPIKKGHQRSRSLT